MLGQSMQRVDGAPSEACQFQPNARRLNRPPTTTGLARLSYPGTFDGPSPNPLQTMREADGMRPPAGFENRWRQGHDRRQTSWLPERHRVHNEAAVARIAERAGRVWILQYFPDRRHPDAGAYADAYFSRIAAAAATVDRGALNAAAQLLTERATKARMIFSCGNGGSAAIANHLVCDCMKGVRTSSTLRPRVYSLSTTIETITAIGNDIGYEQVFAFQLESLGQPGDVLIAISSSGASPNIVNALATAREMKISTIAMTGFSGGAAGDLADINLLVDAHNYGIVEDVHQSLMHILAQYLRHGHLEDATALGRIKF